MMIKDYYYKKERYRQESRAIAKMTARCALYTGMDVLEKFGSPWLRPWLLFPKLLMGFCCDRSYKSAYKIWSS